jgi:hypothetical protein
MGPRVLSPDVEDGQVGLPAAFGSVGVDGGSTLAGVPHDGGRDLDFRGRKLAIGPVRIRP